LDVYGSTPTYSYNDIQGGATGTGNINADPLFARSPSPGADGAWGTADDDYGDLRLQTASPCIDAQSSTLGALTTDIAGHTRKIDYPGVHDPGVFVDMGAYERATDVTGAAGGSGSDALYARMSADGTSLQLWTSLTPTGTPQYTYPLATTESYTFNGGPGADTLVIDASAGVNFPTLSFQAGADGDSTVITGTSGSSDLTVASDHVTLGASTVLLAGNETIRLDGTAGGAVRLHRLATSTLVSLTAGKHLALDVNTLSVTAPGGTLNLADGAMVLRNSSLASVRAIVGTAFNRGAWNGSGLTSSTAAADAAGLTAVGFASNATLKKSTFAGVTGLSATDILVKYTYYGDTDLSGVTTLDDFTLFLNGYQGGGNTWMQGDFDFSGVVTLDDFTLFLRGYQGQGTPL
jgi:hypothetical protein